MLLSSYLLGIIHADEERPEKEINAADDEIPPIKFEEAVKFLEQKMPITKDEWKLLEPKARFRAFTVAKLGSATLIDTVKQQLLGVLEDGKGYSEFWNRINQTVENDVSKIKPGYWETVFRTNTQSAYVAGKLQQFENSGVAAYQLMVIEDVRTSRICRNLLNKNSGYGIILPVKHPFWQKYGFPPYHFNCRSSIRGVWPSQVGKIGNVVENPTMKSLKIFKPQGDFGGNPLIDGSWWELTKGQIEQANEFGVLHILQLTQANIKTGARSSIVNKLLQGDVIENEKTTNNYYISIRNSDNKKMIKFQSLPRHKRQLIRDEVLRLYAETDLSYSEIAEENCIQLRTVEYIVRNFASELPTISAMRNRKKGAGPEDYDKLRAEVIRLQKELRYEKMRAEALDTMIDVAEEMFNIPVRKKAGTKQ